MDGSEELRSKKELIENFIINNLPTLSEGTDLETEFEDYLAKEKAIANFIEEHQLHEDKIEETMAKYTFTKKIDRDQIKETFKEDLDLKARKLKIPIVSDTIKKIIARFTW